MKPIAKLCCLWAVLALPAVVLADEGEKPRGGGAGRGPEAGERRGPGRPDPGAFLAQRSPLLLALDADKDGVLSASEIENSAKALLKLDRNGDGSLSLDEMRPDPETMGRGGLAEGRGFGGPGPGRPGSGEPGGRGPGNGPPSGEMLSRMLEMRDTNGDGKLSGDEIPERLAANLERIDENGDGSLEESELRKAMERMAGRAGGRGPQGAGDGSGQRPRRPPQE